MLNQAPFPWTIDDLTAHLREGPRALIDGVEVPCRPYGYYGLRHRLRAAWLVFTGRADTLVWPCENPKAY